MSCPIAPETGSSNDGMETLSRIETTVFRVILVLRTEPKDGTGWPSYLNNNTQRIMVIAAPKIAPSTSVPQPSSNHRVYKAREDDRIDEGSLVMISGLRAVYLVSWGIVLISNSSRSIYQRDYVPTSLLYSSLSQRPDKLIFIISGSYI